MPYESTQHFYLHRKWASRGGATNTNDKGGNENMSLKKPVFIAFFMAFLMIGLVAPVAAVKLEDGTKLSGWHYNLNLIGMKKQKHSIDGVMDNNGHRIFVPLSGKTRILLQKGDYDVIDADGTDGEAIFQLPDPGDVISGVAGYNPAEAEYRIYIRVLGKPNGQITLTSGLIEMDGSVWLSTENVVRMREKGKSLFTDVTKELTTILVDYDEDGVVERVKLFDPEFDEFFWQVDNSGCKLTQLRFYPVEAL